MAFSAPLLSAFDPEISSEGGIDPFSLSGTYERLAERIFPFMTVRMSRPRFLTAMAVGAVVCQDFRDELASDGKTPAWLVFEWHVIEALFRVSDRFNASDGGWGIRVPGVGKVKAAVEGGHSVGADSYLKTPKIFGFTGIYRRLALGLDILDDDLRISEGGWELLSAWEAERNLRGFMRDSGDGGEFRRELRGAVALAMKKGCTCQTKNWSGWQHIAEHFRPDGARKKEATVISSRLRRIDLRQNPHDVLASQMRADLFEALEARGESVSTFGEEAQWFRSIRRKCAPAMAERLDAIDAFEGVCALIMNAFDLIRHLSTKAGTVITAKGFSSYKDGRNASQVVSEMPTALERLKRHYGTSESGSQTEQLLARYGEVRNAEDLFVAIIEHHESAQSRKAPDGKRSWFDRDERGVCIRALYRVTDAPVRYDYTHDYRSATASRFLRDLRRLPA